MLVFYFMCTFVLSNILKRCFIYFSLQNSNALSYCSLKMRDPGLELSTLTVQ